MRKLRSFPMFVVVLSMGLPVVLFALSSFSLGITLADSDSTTGASYALYSDSDAPTIRPYIDRSEGRVPTVIMSKSAGIELDTRGSTRTVCFNFNNFQQVLQPSVAPMNTCAPVLLRTLTTTDNGAVGDLAVGDAKSFSMDVYWTGLGADGKAHDYVLGFKRQNNSGIWVSHPDANTWQIDPINGTAGVGIYRTGKNGGWSDVGTYVMPFHITANRLTQLP